MQQFLPFIVRDVSNRYSFTVPVCNVRVISGEFSQLITSRHLAVPEARMLIPHTSKPLLVIHYIDR